MFGYGQQSAYCASKGALIPLAKSLALAWAPDGINVNVVLPGAINTPFTQVKGCSALQHTQLQHTAHTLICSFPEGRSYSASR